MFEDIAVALSISLYVLFFHKGQLLLTTYTCLKLYAFYFKHTFGTLMERQIWRYNIGIETGINTFSSCFQYDLLIKLKFLMDLC